MALLRQLMIEDMQVRSLAPHTQATYILHVSLRIPGEVGHRFRTEVGH
jgi:hypothetical protein